MNASDIRAAYETANPNGHFFDRATMKFFGDTMRNFGACTDAQGRTLLFRRKAVKHGLTGTWVFDGRTLTKVES